MWSLVQETCKKAKTLEHQQAQNLRDYKEKLCQVSIGRAQLLVDQGGCLIKF